jgi:hypothetical protein
MFLVKPVQSASTSVAVAMGGRELYRRHSGTGLKMVLPHTKRKIFYFIAALRPLLRSSKFITGKNSTFAPISKNGSATTGIISADGISIMKMPFLSPFTPVKYAAATTTTRI